MFGKVTNNRINWFSCLVCRYWWFGWSMMWNISYALNLPLNRIAYKYASEGATDKMHVANVIGTLIGFACRFIPAVIVLTS